MNMIDDPLSPKRAAADRTGRDYLEKRSRLTKDLAARANFKQIQVVDDDQFDADVLASLLRKLLGPAVRIEQSKSINALPRQWAGGLPDLIFLDDRLGHIGTANTAVPLLRKLGFAGPIVVTSGLLSRQRRMEVMRLGVAATLHKDDLDTLSVIECLLAVIDSAP
jgi:CheY-like chemotaxis protein